MEWWAFLLALIVLTPILVLWVGCFIDVFGRPDIGVGKKALWFAVILILPLIGSLVYIVTRPKVILAPEDESLSVFDQAWEGQPQGMFDVGVDNQSTPRQPYI